MYGCSDIFSPACAASIASLPSNDMNTLYWLESDVRTSACSFLNGRNTGALNVNVVGLEASADMNTSSGSLTTLDKGRISWF